jgi:hypothetical protein
MKRYALKLTSILCIWLTLAAPIWAADLTVIVDTALTEVPVNKVPLVDDADFKSIEGAVAYNAAGMALRWHFVTTGGAYTVTSVTPTTAGDYDWTDQGDSGVYTIEIPASAGASINNDTEGVGWFTGVATGVLPWTGPTIQFVPANIANSLTNGSAKLLVDVDTIKTNPVVNGGTITFPSGATLASTTNITAGTITTTTNLTNLPTIPANWITAAGINTAAFTDDEFAITGSEFTAIPWNAAWDAEAESEATDALNAYDGPTRTEATSDKDEILRVTDSGRIWYVDDTDGAGDTGTFLAPFDTIGAGISAAVAGDTVRVRAGTYSGNITLTPGITLEGEGEGTVLTHSGAEKTLTLADDCTVRKMRIVHTAGQTVWCVGADRVSLDELVIEGTGDGLVVANCNSPVITRCKVTAETDAALFSNVHNFQIICCNFFTDGTTTGADCRALAFTNDGTGVVFASSCDSANSTNSADTAYGVAVLGTTVQKTAILFEACDMHASHSDSGASGDVKGLYANDASVTLLGCNIVTSQEGSGDEDHIECEPSATVAAVGTKYDGSLVTGTIKPIDNDVAAILVDTGTTLDDLVDDLETRLTSARGGYLDILNDGTNGNAAIRTAVDGVSAGTSPNLLQTTAIATLSTQTSFTLTAGSADNDAYNDQLAVIVDQSTATQKASIAISDYVGSTKTVTLAATPIFTIAAGDTIHIIAAPPATVSGTVDANLVQMGGNTQSATDLKDFADAGYDPSANLITGIGGTITDFDTFKDDVLLESSTLDELYEGSELEGDIAAIELSEGGSPISPINVDDRLAWKFNTPQETTANNYIVERVGFEGDVAMDFTKALGGAPTLLSVVSVTITAIDPADTDEPVLSAGTLSQDKKKVHINCDSDGADVGSYYVVVRVLTTDGRTIPRRGRLALQ